VRCKTTSEYEAIILTPEQAFTVLLSLAEPERTLTLLAAGAGLRISECLGLQGQDVDFANQLIRVRRTWVHGHVGVPKTKASKAPVPMHFSPGLVDSQVAPGVTVLSARPLGVPQLPAERQETTVCEHAGLGLSAAGSGQRRSSGEG
jgi:Phage integrase family